jgi:hypothetical protein
MTVCDESAVEGLRQIDDGDVSTRHDDEYHGDELALAAARYARNSTACTYDLPEGGKWIPPLGWPWSSECWKSIDRRRDLVRAAALVVAEVERLDRTTDDRHG